ncbi:hypothetical protein DPEC_G00173160 [Dallia pectoralis]|uniref:Uncharacterized protein n=1 Tax=Dallia pectoralis TaxID=75939 RepID=A0ACC2GE22_DALPE|nr:hypothetical protein DPEC_G00173160 [Dallia pectoralis]
MKHKVNAKSTSRTTNLLCLDIVLNMQDLVVRVFVVAVGLLYPIPREEWTRVQEDDITTGMQAREEWLLKQRAKLEKEQEVPLINQEVSPVVTLEEAAIDRKRLRLEVKPCASDIGEKNSDEIVVNHSQESSKYLTDQVRSKPQQEVQLQLACRKSSAHQKPLTQQRSDKNQEDTEILSQSSEEDHRQGEHGTIWYLWNTCTLFGMIRWFLKFILRNSQKDPRPQEVLGKDVKDGSAVKNLSAEVLLPDSDTLNRFYDKCVKVPSNESCRVREFVEGLVNDLLEAMSSDAEVGVVIEDFNVVEGGINSLVCDIIVPIAPLEPHRFQFQLWCDQNNDEYMPPETQGCGRVKVVSGDVTQNGCPCHKATVDDDMLCLLCGDNGKIKLQKVTDVLDNPLCSDNTAYLNKTRVTKWFRTAINTAWGKISHKYEFELKFRNKDAAGALSVRFRSGRLMMFNMAPVVKLKDTHAHFTISPCNNNMLATDWLLSLATYENHLLKYLTNLLPENSCHIQCLEITTLLYRKQMELTGRGALVLRDHHLKTVLMHLLLSKVPSQWNAELLSDRLRDTLGFLEKSLRSRTLRHGLIGNPLVPSDVKLPAGFTEAKPINLFHPDLAPSGCYDRTAKHLQEMIRNSFMLVHEYVEH